MHPAKNAASLVRLVERAISIEKHKVANSGKCLLIPDKCGPTSFYLQEWDENGYFPVEAALRQRRAIVEFLDDPMLVGLLVAAEDLTSICVQISEGDDVDNRRPEDREGEWEYLANDAFSALIELDHQICSYLKDMVVSMKQLAIDLGLREAYQLNRLTMFAIPVSASYVQQGFPNHVLMWDFYSLKRDAESLSRRDVGENIAKSRVQRAETRDKAPMPSPSDLHDVGKAKRKRRRATKKEKWNRDRAILVVAGHIMVKYDRWPTVYEITENTGYSARQVYESSVYKEGKVLKRSAKLTTELADSATTSEFFGRNSIGGSRAKRRTEAKQQELENQIDEQSAEDRRNRV